MATLTAAAPNARPARGSGRSDGFVNAMITLSIMTATVMNSLDSTIANVALPHIQGSVSASQDQITWVLTSYIVAAAIMTPVTGWLAARFGRKLVFLASIVGFTIASALCGVASSLVEIVLFRLLQGLCGAALIPLSQSVLLDINPKEKHGQAMAVWGMGAMLGPIMGPALGGWLTENYSWRWVFYINVPFGIAAALGVLFFISGEREATIPRFDFVGFFALALGIGALQLMLDRGELAGWFDSREIWIEAALAGLGFYWTAVNTATADAPFVRRRLLKNANFVTACVFGFFVGIILFATLTLLPPMLEDLLGYPVVTTGFVTAPRGFGTLFSMFIVGRLIGRVDTRLILLAGLGITAYALWGMTHFTIVMGEGPIVVSGVLQGLGIGLIFVPLSTLAFSTLDPVLRTEGAGIYTLVRNIGSSVGISIVEALQTQNVQKVHANLVTGLSPGNPNLAGSMFDLGSTRGLVAANGEVTRQALMVGYIDSFKFMMVIALVAMPLLLVMRAPKRAGGLDPAHMAME